MNNKNEITELVNNQQVFKILSTLTKISMEQNEWKIMIECKFALTTTIDKR